MAKEKIEAQETTTTEMAEYEGSFEQVIPMDSAFSAEGENAVFCSMTIAPENKQDLFKLHTIKNNPKHRLNDCIGSVIRCTGFVAHWVPTKNPATGEVGRSPRIVLIDDQGDSYVAVSVGVFNALRQICMDLWTPDAKAPISVLVKKEKGKHGFEYTTLEVVSVD